LLSISNTVFSMITPAVIRVESGDLIVTGSTFFACGNSTNSPISLKSSTASFDSTTFNGNSGLVSAISVLSNGNSLGITNCVFVNNSATVFSNGGTIVVRGVLAQVNIISSNFTNNACLENSAVIYLSNATTNLQNLIFMNNMGAGAVSIFKQKAIVDSCVFANDYAPNDDGVGFYISAATVTISKTNITNNTAQYGGAIYLDSGSLTLDTCIVSNNTALLAGSLYVRDQTSIVIIRDCQFIDNFSTQDNDLSFEFCGGAQSVANSVTMCSGCPCAGFQCDCRYPCCPNLLADNFLGGIIIGSIGVAFVVFICCLYCYKSRKGELNFTVPVIVEEPK